MKEQNKQTNNKKKSNKILFILIIAALIFTILVSAKLISMSNISEYFSKYTYYKEEVSDNSLEIDANDDSSIVSFAPKEIVDINNNEDKEELANNPYEELIESSSNEEDTEEENEIPALKNNLKEYRLYIQNANRLVQKFQSDQEYSFELNILTQRPLPSRVGDIITLLESYNIELTSNSSEYKEIKLLNSNLLSQFLRVKQVPESAAKKEALKVKIMERLNIFTDYIFSTELQNDFIKFEL